MRMRVSMIATVAAALAVGIAASVVHFIVFGSYASFCAKVFVLSHSPPISNTRS